MSDWHILGSKYKICICVFYKDKVFPVLVDSLLYDWRILPKWLLLWVGIHLILNPICQDISILKNGILQLKKVTWEKSNCLCQCNLYKFLTISYNTFQPLSKRTGDWKWGRAKFRPVPFIKVLLLREDINSHFFLRQHTAWSASLFFSVSHLPLNAVAKTDLCIYKKREKTERLSEYYKPFLYIKEWKLSTTLCRTPAPIQSNPVFPVITGSVVSYRCLLQNWTPFPRSHLMQGSPPMHPWGFEVSVRAHQFSPLLSCPHQSTGIKINIKHEGSSNKNWAQAGLKIFSRSSQTFGDFVRILNVQPNSSNKKYQLE